MTCKHANGNDIWCAYEKYEKWVNAYEYVWKCLYEHMSIMQWDMIKWHMCVYWNASPIEKCKVWNRAMIQVLKVWIIVFEGFAYDMAFACDSDEITVKMSFGVCMYKGKLELCMQ